MSLIIYNKLFNSVSPNQFQMSYLDLLQLISTNGLVVGSLYTIQDADPELYGGTLVTLIATSINSLSPEGLGYFYNPNYNSYPVFANDIMMVRTKVDTSIPYYYYKTYNAADFYNFNTQYVLNNSSFTDTYTVKNLMEYNPGNTQYQYSYFYGPQVNNIATTNGGVIAGSYSANTISSDNQQYTLNYLGSSQSGNAQTIFVATQSIAGSRYIWGGYVWENTLGGLTGSIVDTFTLTLDKVPYDDFNAYNESVDEVTYDIGSNMISSRRDRLMNEVTFTTQSYSTLNSFGLTFSNPIKYFKWGDANRVYSNRIINSVFNCININTSNLIVNNKINNSKLLSIYIDRSYYPGTTSSITNNIINNTSEFFPTTSYLSLYLMNTTFSNNTFNGCIFFNTYISGEFSNNNLNSFSIANYYQTNLATQSVVSQFNNNSVDTSIFIENYHVDNKFTYNNITNNSIYYNNYFRIGSTNSNSQNEFNRGVTYSGGGTVSISMTSSTMKTFGGLNDYVGVSLPFIGVVNPETAKRRVDCDTMVLATLRSVPVGTGYVLINIHYSKDNTTYTIIGQFGFHGPQDVTTTTSFFVPYGGYYFFKDESFFDPYGQVISVYEIPI